MPRHRAFLASLAFVTLGAVAAVTAAELQPRTVEAFNRYIQVTEARMKTEVEGEAPFLWVDRLPNNQREDIYARLRAGEVVVEKLETRDGGARIDIPSGMVHHWVGTVLIPDVSLTQTIAMVQDYDRYAEIYAPQVRKSAVRERQDNRFKVYAQLYEKKVLTFVANTEYDAEFVSVDDTRVYVPSYTTRILEVEHPDTPQEREKAEGNDRGLLWRFNNYCSFEERGTDTYMQCESISLTRGIPFLLNVVIKPFVTGLPRDKMAFTLDAARRHLTALAP